MLKNENIVCISSIDWDFVWQGHQEIMAAFAKDGNRVIFIENTGVRSPRIKDVSRIKKRINNWLKGVKGISKEIDNLYVFSPIILPFPYSRLARWFNRWLLLSVLKKWMKVMRFDDPIIWTFLPTGLALDILNELDSKLIVYYCIADFEALVPNPRKVRKTETAVIRKADVVFVQGEMLKRRCDKYNPNVTIFPFGVNMQVFNNNLYPVGERPAELKNSKGDIVGYVGGVHHHIDFELIKFIAERNPKLTLVLVGPIQTEISKITDLPNVIFVKNQEHKELAKYINSFKVCLIPYVLNDYTQTVYPTKLNEYLAMGKAVVSTALPEILKYNIENDNIVYIGKNKEEFEIGLKRALMENDPSLCERRVKAAEQNRWESRIEKMSVIMEEVIEKKKIETEKEWKEKLIKFYRKTRKKIIRISAVIFAAYLIIFKTPFIWFLASPLKISESPKKAQAIVVFGGGVGESGSPGKSTIERARYAGQLYLDNYAKNIIFSSGYTYFYNDAENMKLIAVSMGIPANDIILEQKANCAYENVRLVKEILNQRKWDSVLLISSPYNMRRVQLVFNKAAKNINVVYVPVEKSEFYDKSSGVKFEQIKAIIHEYLGILYYLLKGYI